MFARRDSRAKKKKKFDAKELFFRKRACKFCLEKIDFVDYKDIGKLRKFITEKGKIMPNRMTGTCARHQRKVAIAIKRARFVALLPYVAE